MCLSDFLRFNLLEEDSFLELNLERSRRLAGFCVSIGGEFG